MPLVTAEKSMNAACVRRAMIFARVVFPTPEDHGGDGVGENQATQQLALAQQMALADKLLQRRRAHAGRQGLTRAGRLLLGQKALIVFHGSAVPFSHSSSKAPVYS